MKYEHNNRIEETMIYELYKLLHIRREFTIIDPKSFVSIISHLGEQYETEFYPDFSKLIDLICDMKLSFILSERNIIATALRPAEFYDLIANLNLIISESSISKVIKNKLFKIGKVYVQIYEFQVKRKAAKFVSEEGMSVQEYFEEEAAEFMELEGNF